MANETTTVPQVVETTTVPLTTTLPIKANEVVKADDELSELNDQVDNSETGLTTDNVANKDYMYLELLRAIPTFGGLQLTADERTDLAQITIKIVKHLTSDL